MTNTLIYVHDPLCGWCYGFIAAIEEVKKERPDLRILVKLGGLGVGDRIAPYNTIAEYIKGAAPKVAAMTGATYGDAFLNERIMSEELVSSNPPCAAILQLRNQHPDRTLDFAHAVQNAHFQGGADLNDAGVYPPLAEALGLTDVAFDIPAPRDVPDDLAAEYAATRALNFQGFPSLFVADQQGGELQDIRPVELSYHGAQLLQNLQAVAPVAEAV